MPLTGTVDKSRTFTTSKLQDVLGKKILVVGGTSGLGRAIAVEAAGRGATVKVVGRTFKDDAVNGISFEKADLSLMTEAKRIGETVDDDYNIVLFTQGIIAATKREETTEGIEMDMAVSYLSRLVILNSLIPRLKKGARVFIMGFPGSAPDSFNIDDLNAEQSYSGGLGFVHANTIVGNEALVLVWAEKDKEHSFFGLNPGLIKTDIRKNVYDTAVMKTLGVVIEGMLGMLSTSAEKYGKRMADLLFAEGIEDHSGVSFNPKAQPTLKSPMFLADASLAKTIVEKSEALVKEKTGI